MLDTPCATCRMGRLPLFLFIALLVLGLAQGQSRELCEFRCQHNIGGNMCNCNAYHFSGKRAQASAGVSENRGGPVGGLSSLLEQEDAAAGAAADSLTLADVLADGAQRNIDTGLPSFPSSSSSSLSPNKGQLNSGARFQFADDGSDEGFFGVRGHHKTQRLVDLLMNAQREGRLGDNNGDYRK